VGRLHPNFTPYAVVGKGPIFQIYDDVSCELSLALARGFPPKELKSIKHITVKHPAKF